MRKLSNLEARLRSAEQERDLAVSSAEHRVRYVDLLEAKLSEVERERDRYREALEWYSDLRNYKHDIKGRAWDDIHYAGSAVMDECGERARLAISPSGGKDSSGEDRGDYGEPGMCRHYIPDAKERCLICYPELGRLQCHSGDEDRGEGGEG